MAVEFAYRFVDRYHQIWWVPAEPRGRRAGRRVNPGGAPGDGWLGATGLQWLLVYDNANKPEDLTLLVPAAVGADPLTASGTRPSTVLTCGY